MNRSLKAHKIVLLAMLICPGLLSGQATETSAQTRANMKALVLRYYDCWNKGTIHAIDEILSKEYVRHEDGNTQPAIVGPEAIKNSIAVLKGAYSNFKISISDLLISGDRVITVWRLTGTQTGPLGEIPPTGKPVDVSGVLISRMAKGKIVEEWSFFNQLNLMAQLGYTIAPPNQRAASTTPASGKVIINGQALSAEQLAQLERRYGVKAQPGNYWYDAKSGLYGMAGQPAAGFMYPDHHFGTLARNASNGHTRVIVNGRELPQAEWALWSQILGYWIQPGAYWFDAGGNAGYEGNPTPVVNFYAAAQQNAYQGNSGGGGGFWSTRFSAGNAYAGNQTGYVSLPGGGIVGYGN